MKSAHRHDLQTNALAQRLDDAIQRLRPHTSTIGFVLVAIAVVLLIWSYLSSSSVSRQGQAWDEFSQALGAMPPNLEQLHQSAQEHPGTKMQELADITWADGEVLKASDSFLYNRRQSREALDRATGAYVNVLQSTRDPHLINRAHLGLARVYEMRNELDKAIDEYKKLTGAFAEYGKFQAERLEKPEAKEAYAWLEKAEPPRGVLPAGPGIPGQRPAFTPGELELPDAEGGAPGPSTGEAVPTFEDLLKGLRQLPPADDSRYEEGQNEAETTTQPPAAEEAPPPADEEPSN